MREITTTQIVETVKRLCIEANCHLPKDMKDCISNAYEKEPWSQAREILERLLSQEEE